MDDKELFDMQLISDLKDRHAKGIAEARKLIWGLVQIIEDYDILIHKAVDLETIKASGAFLISTDIDGVCPVCASPFKSQRFYTAKGVKCTHKYHSTGIATHRHPKA